MTKTRLIGDIHGKWSSYQFLIQSDKITNSIQIGDFGIGFAGTTAHEKLAEWQRQNPGHCFIRGNHDNPSKCQEMPNFIHDGLVENDVMFVGGAWSIDRGNRVEGLDWWPDEELSYEELSKMIDIYELVKPRVMITHDCPSSVSYQLFVAMGKSMFGGVSFKTRTAEAFESMFSIHKPDLWVFGHWHNDVDAYIKNTRFICLDELSHIDVDFETLEIMKPKSFGEPRIRM